MFKVSHRQGCSSAEPYPTVRALGAAAFRTRHVYSPFLVFVGAPLALLLISAQVDLINQCPGVGGKSIGYLETAGNVNQLRARKTSHELPRLWFDSRSHTPYLTHFQLLTNTGWKVISWNRHKKRCCRLRKTSIWSASWWPSTPGRAGISASSPSARPAYPPTIRTSLTWLTGGPIRTS